jgi:diadenylate cyclase
LSGNLAQFLENALFILSHLRLQDFLDLLLVWIVVYKILMLIKRTGTLQMLSGLAVLSVSYILSIWFELNTFNWILEKFFSNLFVIVVILFQAEIRRALAQIGSSPFFSDGTSAQETHVIEEVVKSVSLISQRGYGALIVMEKELLVDYHIEKGTEVDAIVSSELLLSVFHPSSPVHDGAVLIRNGKVHSVGCFLPLSKNPNLDKNLGTRHRAAIGLTEETDALVLVVSEETRIPGFVTGGHLVPVKDFADLRVALYDYYGLKMKTYQTADF